MLLNTELRQDIIEHFEKLVTEMPLRDQKKKKPSLGGISPLQMLKHLKEGTEIGNHFVEKMINIAFQSCSKEIGTLNLALTIDDKSHNILN